LGLCFRNVLILCKTLHHFCIIYISNLDALRWVVDCIQVIMPQNLPPLTDPYFIHYLFISRDSLLYTDPWIGAFLYGALVDVPENPEKQVTCPCVLFWKRKIIRELLRES